MQMMPSLQVKQKQALVMTPQLQQAIKLLQMTNFDICNFLQEQALENPFIEVENGTDHTPAADLAPAAAPAAEAEAAAAPSAGEGLDRDMKEGGALADDPTAHADLENRFGSEALITATPSAASMPISTGTVLPTLPSRAPRALCSSFFARST